MPSTRDKDAILNQQMNQRVNNLSNNLTLSFKSRHGVRSFSGWKQQRRRRQQKSTTPSHNPHSSRSPLDELKKTYIREHAIQKFEAYFDIATRAKKLHQLQLQKSNDLRMTHSINTTNTNPKNRKKTTSNATIQEKRLIQVIQQQSRSISPYSAPEYYPPTDYPKWRTPTETKQRIQQRRTLIRPSTYKIVKSETLFRKM